MFVWASIAHFQLALEVGNFLKVEEGDVLEGGPLDLLVPTPTTSHALSLVNVCVIHLLGLYLCILVISYKNQRNHYNIGGYTLIDEELKGYGHFKVVSLNGNYLQTNHTYKS